MEIAAGLPVLVTGARLDEAVRGAGLVFHLGGLTKALSSAGFYRANTQGTENLLRVLERHAPVRLIHVSSLAGVGPSADGAPLSEDAPPHPVTHYGRSKLAAEEAVRRSALASSAVIVRPPVVYGPRETDVYQVLRLVARGLLVRIGRDEEWFSFIHASDLVEGLLAAARSDQAPGRTWFLANEEPASWTGFAATATAIMGRELRVFTAPAPLAWAVGLAGEVAGRIRRRPGIISREKIAEARCRWWVCDPSRARRELGFTPRQSLGDGLAETLNWYKRAGWLRFPTCGPLDSPPAPL
ncbi:MAG: NAD-dependent epimerase/dehydratase family protein [Acidobacteriota bacterium]